ncbi:NUDIX domain-containing protein [Sinomonas halotolerans]
MRSAGILLYRRAPAAPGGLEVWIAHMGGPFWARKDERAWSIPKGEYAEGEDPFEAALREFAEEMGSPAPQADYVPLGEFRQPSGKLLAVFAAEAEFAPDRIASNTFPLEWPKGSGRMLEVPETDRAEWLPEAVARVKLVRGQIPILDALAQLLAG